MSAKPAPRGRPPGRPCSSKKSEIPYQFCSTFYECHGKTIYGCCFDPYSSNPSVFATVGENRITVYTVPDNPNSSIKLRIHFQDSAHDEAFFAVCWAYDTDFDQHAVVAGGIRGIIRVVNASNGSLINNLCGHGDAVNDIRVCPNDSTLIASASKDFTARIWNIRNSACLAILGGVQGHLDQVISVDFDESCDFLASASMDHTIKLWYIGEGSGADRRIAQARSDLRLIDDPAELHYPYGSTRDIHTNYVDCVRIFHKVLISKSTESEIVIWKFGDLSDPISGCGTELKTENSVLHIQQLSLPDTSMWFIRFQIDPTERYLVCGNQSGEIHVWELTDTSLPSRKSNFILRAKDVCCTVRQVAFSPCGEHMIAVADDASVSRFQRNPNL
ncbi:hypothetical protein AB6A40_002940 [Gnathostoma spinigerum]|uniref:Uncharacterized protein n=1 Tax=Gnathostoma spinigerum TaxID=75299 RepID=A0ABD6EAK8_9BILA